MMVTRHTRAVAALAVCFPLKPHCAAEGFAARDVTRDHQ